MKEQFVCAVKGCLDAKNGRVFGRSLGLVRHYQAIHGSADLGRMQVRRQRQEAAEADADAEARLAADQPQPFSELPTMVVEKFDETGEQLPPVVESPMLMGPVSQTDIAQILEEHLGRVTEQLKAAQSRRDTADFELKKLQAERVRVEAARKAYAMEVESRDPEAVLDGGEYS